MVLRRDVRLVNEMYHIAVEADDDDDDEIVSQPPLSLVPAKLSCWLSVHQSVMRLRPCGGWAVAGGIY